MPVEGSPTLLTAKDLVLRFNDRLILDHATLSIHAGERLGLVGSNGSGKSTLLKILTGGLQPDAGEVMRKRDLLTGYLSQDFTLNPALSVMDNVREGARHILDAIAEFESLPPLSTRHEELEHTIQLHDGWNLDTRIATAMSKLNCPPAHGGITRLSGGELRRVALCRALVAQPDLLILDEPTNHLDAESIEWLGGFLKSFPGAMLLVTHDRCFLDEITQSIVELANGSLFSYEGNYTDYLVGRAEREAAAEVVEHKRQMFLRRELEWVRRGPKAQTSKSKARLDHFFEVQDQKPVESEGDVDLVLPPPPPLGNRVVDLVNVGMELGGRRLFSGLNLSFEAGTRIGITGRNGLGKTTLLKVILGHLPPTEGTVKTGQLVVFNYVDQSRLQLNEERTVFDEVSDGTEYVIWGNDRLSLRGYLRRFLFGDDRIATLVKYLSGGERSRLLLARILKNGGNFLILDEPTNDLDLQTLRVLEEALIRFPGVVVVVSHDRYFLNRVCTGIVAFEGDGRVVHSTGNYDYYVEKRQRSAAEAAQWEPSAPDRRTPQRQAAENKPRKLSFKEQKELDGMEERIVATEESIARIEALFLDPDFHRKHGQRRAGLTAELDAAKATLAGLYQRWEQLEALRTGQGDH